MPFPSHIADIQPFVELNVSSWASVYKAYQPSLDRVVLLKVLNPSFSKEEENAGWFKSEAQLTAKVKHPNVVSVYGYGESDDGLYFTTEFVEGITLREVTERGPVPLPIAVFIIEQMLSGLQAAHNKGVLHRDLKPENVLVSFDGHVKLCDFGFASTVSAGEKSKEVRGTMGYIAPESILEGTVDERGDIFAVGVVLYELMLGRPPFVVENINGYMQAIEHQDPAASLSSFGFIPQGLRELCQRLLDKNVLSRIGSAAEALEHVRSIQQNKNWIISSDVVGRWWENPDTYVASELTQDRSPDREPDVRTRPNPEEKKKGTLWKMSMAVIMIAITIVVANGVARQSNTSSPKAEVMREVTSLNAAEISSGTEDSLSSAHVDAIVSEKEVASLNLLPDPAPEVNAGIPLTAVPQSDIDVDSLQSVQVDTLVAGARDSDVLVDAGEGILTVLCLPSCSVEIGEIEKGNAEPSMTMQLPNGTYKITLDNPDFPRFEQDIQIVKEKHDTLIVSLLETVGTLELEVSPWGEVFIDSTSYGVFPPSNPIKIWPGEHTLRVVHKELGEKELTFTISANERLTRKINLNDP